MSKPYLDGYGLVNLLNRAFTVKRVDDADSDWVADVTVHSDGVSELIASVVATANLMLPPGEKVVPTAQGWVVVQRQDATSGPADDKEMVK